MPDDPDINTYTLGILFKVCQPGWAKHDNRCDRCRIGNNRQTCQMPGSGGTKAEITSGRVIRKTFLV